MFLVVLAFAALGVALGLGYLLSLVYRKFLVNESPEAEWSDDDANSPLLVAKGVEVTQIKSSIYSINWSNVLTLFINGTKVEISNPDPSTLLAYFIRNEVGLKGTKLGCEEGGCGACTVTLTNKNGIVSVNSCLRLLCLNDGMSITTVEGVGSVSSGLSEEQKRLVANNGTQCGFCTPGWINNMHALRESSSLEGKSLSSREIQHYFDGNICRCTGYKPILQAFSTFANENQANTHSCITCPNANTSNCDSHCLSHDLEDGFTSKPSNTTLKIGEKSRPLGSSKNLRLVNSYTPKPLLFVSSSTGIRWVRPLTLDQLCIAIREYSSDPFQLVGGNTSIGVSKYFNESGPYYRPDVVKTYIDINGIIELTTSSYNESTGQLTIGSALSISKTISILREYGKTNHNRDWNDIVNASSCFDVVAHHLSKIANTQVRNAGTWAGNLALFMRYESFPSDAVLALTIGEAELTICNSANGSYSIMSMDKFLQLPANSFTTNKSFIVSFTIKESNYIKANEEISGHVITETFKIAQREHNAHAHVNAGFKFTIIPTNPPVILNARVVYGGVSAKTFIASKTQDVLRSSRVSSSLLSRALVALQSDLSVVGISTSYGNQKFRESVMQSCLYRALLKCYRFTDLPTNLSSAVLPWIKPESRGTEAFVPSHGSSSCSSNSNSCGGCSNTSSFDPKPVGKPIRKLEAPIQATGEAVYPSDEPLTAQTLHAAMVFSTQCSTALLGIDASSALSINGIVAVYTAADIPGTNEIGKDLYLLNPIGTEIKCVGLPVAIIVAVSENLANEAAALVKVSYGPIQPNLITNTTDGVSQKSFFNMPPIPGVTVIKRGEAVKALSEAENRVSGYISAGGQSHFYMETQSAIASVIDGNVVHITCGTQDPASYQSHVAAILGVTCSQVTVKSQRSGGAFGGKITRGIAAASAAALCATKLGRPVRIFNNRTADMIMTGGRESFDFSYELGFSSSGQITALKIDFYIDAGIESSDAFGGLYMGMNWADNAYYIPNYLANATLVYTNTTPRTSMRAPGVLQACLATEMVIERIAIETGIPVATIQQQNFIQDGQSTITGQVITNSTLNTVWDTLFQRSHYSERLQRILSYNESSLWRKRGISICPVKYGIGWSGYKAGVLVGINSVDGTVLVNHTGCEIGQGINTKVAQTIAQELNIPLELIRVTALSTEKIVNGGTTGGSGTSETICQAAINVCKTLNDRFAPYRSSMVTNSVSNRTKDWIKFLSSLPSEVALNAEGWYSPSTNPNGQAFQYFVYAACLTEIALDVLSGQVHVLASEIVYDCGQSLNPAVDIGQIEGGFVQGLGYFLSEKVWFSSTGNLETIGTWEYKPPLGSDIPSILNVTLIKDAYNNDGILGSKATGEPCMVATNSIYFATKMAIESARKDAGSNAYFNMEVPSTIDVRQQTCLVNPRRFVMPNDV